MHIAFSTAKIITRKRLNVTLYVHFLGIFKVSMQQLFLFSVLNIYVAQMELREALTGMSHMKRSWGVTRNKVLAGLL